MALICDLPQARNDLFTCAVKPAWCKEHDGNQQQADDRQPMERIGGGNDILEPHEGDGADQRTVKRTRAAEHQHDQRFGRKREAEAVEADDLGGDGIQRTANAGDDARYDEHLQNRAVDDAAHGLNADAVLLDAAAQHAEG